MLNVVATDFWLYFISLTTWSSHNTNRWEVIQECVIVQDLSPFPRCHDSGTHPYLVPACNTSCNDGFAGLLIESKRDISSLQPFHCLTATHLVSVTLMPWEKLPLVSKLCLGQKQITCKLPHMAAQKLISGFRTSTRCQLTLPGGSLVLLHGVHLAKHMEWHIRYK